MGAKKVNKTKKVKNYKGYKDYKFNKEIEKYFDKNNMRYAKPYKVYNTKYEVLKVFNMYFDDEEFEYEELITGLREKEPELQYLLNNLKKLSTEEYRNDVKRKRSWAVPTDNRRGWESYKFDNIKGDMIYITDRWYCIFRIQWILDALYYLKVKESICVNTEKKD
jgi:hypothetical protein